MIKIERLNGRITACSNKDGKAKRPDQAPPLMKVITFTVNVTDHLRELRDSFPGADDVAKLASADDSPGVDQRAKRKACDVTVTLSNPLDQRVLGPIVLRGSAPRLTIGQAGKNATMTITVTGVLPPDQRSVADDYWQADLWVSIVPKQPDLPGTEGKPGKPPKRGKKAEQVEIEIPRGDDVELGDR